MKEGRDFWGINGELKVLSTDDDVICVEFVPLERENGELTKKKRTGYILRENVEKKNKKLTRAVPNSV